MTRLITGCIFLLLSLGTQAQMKLMDLDSSRIRFKSVWQFTQKQKRLGFNFFNELPSSCFEREDSQKYSQHTGIFYIQTSLDQAWEAYRNLRPQEAWNGKTVKFSFSYNRSNDSLHYADNVPAGIQEGQILFFHLKLLGGVKKLGVAFEIKRLDRENREMEYCYLKNGQSEGTQTLRFEAVDSNLTRVIHFTRYKSQSHFRDKRLYPGLHQKCIREFHQNVSRWISQWKEFTQEPTLPVPSLRIDLRERPVFAKPDYGRGLLVLPHENS